MTKIRPETEADHEALAAVVRAAFGGEDEVALITRLRSDGDALVALVASQGEAILGHILFSPLKVEIDGAPVPAAALAPVAVRPEHQGRGLGGQLIEAGLEACGAAGIAAVVVLGHPDYYPRFGFSAALARKLRAPFPAMPSWPWSWCPALWPGGQAASAMRPPSASKTRTR